MISKLNLPMLDVELVLYELNQSKLKNPDIHQAGIDRSQNQKLVDPKINGACFELHITDAITHYGLQTFQPLFKHKMFCNAVTLSNINPNLGVAHYMPHFDHKRTVGINFCISPGGPNVTTSFYDEDGGYQYHKSANFRPYSEVSNPQPHKLNSQEWVCIDTNRFHSVDNIETERILFTMSFFDISWTVFKKSYPELVIH